MSIKLPKTVISETGPSIPLVNPEITRKETLRNLNTTKVKFIWFKLHEPNSVKLFFKEIFKLSFFLMNMYPVGPRFTTTWNCLNFCSNLAEIQSFDSLS